jgi:hypothetical protein
VPDYCFGVEVVLAVGLNAKNHLLPLLLPNRARCFHYPRITVGPIVAATRDQPHAVAIALQPQPLSREASLARLGRWSILWGCRSRNAFAQDRYSGSEFTPVGHGLPWTPRPSGLPLFTLCSNLDNREFGHARHQFHLW